MRTNGDNVNEICREIESAEWYDAKYGLWVLAFVVQLTRFGAKARQSSDKNASAKGLAHRLAWHLGQLIEDPLWAREEERQDQDRRRIQYEEAVMHHQQDGWPISKYVLWNADTAQAEVDGTFRDNDLANGFLRRLVLEFGLLEQLKAALPAMQVSEDPLFTTEAWPRWWAWAEDGFFHPATPNEAASK